MKIRNARTDQIAYYLFYAAVIIEVLMVIVDKSSYTNPIEGRLFQLTFLMFLGKVCLTKYSRKEYVCIFLFCLLGIISYFAADRNEVLRFVIFIAACKNMDMEKCLKLVFWMTLAGCLLLILLSVTGIYGAAVLTQEYGRGEVESRYILGLGHPNALQCMVWALTTLGLFLYSERMKWYGYFGALAVNLFFFYLTDSKTSLLAAVFTIIYMAVVKAIRNDIFRKICCVCGGIITIGCIVFSIVIAANAYRVYNYHWYMEWSETTDVFLKLDDALTGRIHSLVGTVRWEGTTQTWSLFSAPENHYYFDMGWIRLFYWYGIIPAGIFIIVLFLLMIYCVRQKKYMAFIMIVSFAVYTVIEAHAVSVYLARNYVLFLLGAYWGQMIDGRKKSA